MKTTMKTLTILSMLSCFAGFIFIVSCASKVEDSNRYNQDIIKDYLEQKFTNANSDSEFLRLNEIKECFNFVILFETANSLYGKDLILERFIEKEDYYSQKCINLRMRQNMRNDASRFDLLAREFKANNIKYDMGNVDVDFSELFEDSSYF